MPEYTIVIPSLYEVDSDYLKVCVESLRASGFGGQIIVVTNGTKTQPSLKHIRGISRHIHTREQGQCNAVNIGAQQVGTKFMLISNSDMYYAPGWNKNLRFEHPVFSPNLLEPVDNPGSAPPFLKVDGGNDLEAFKPEVVNEEVARVTESKVVPEPGFNFPLFISRHLWSFLGGYDTAYDPWGSNGDTDLQTRINLAGVIPMRYTDVLVYHFSNKSGTFDGTHQDFYVNNIEYFRSKFGFDRDELGSDVWRNKDMLPKDAGKIKYKQDKYVQRDS